MAQVPPDDDRITRRALLEGGLAAGAWLALPHELRRLVGRGTAPPRGPSPYFTASLRAERWIAASAVRSARGITWPVDPIKPAETALDLYHGSPGVVLFYLELFAATKDMALLETASLGADYLVTSLPAEGAPLGEEGAGLYTGLAGVAFALERTYAASGVTRYRAAAQRAMRLVHGAASAKGAGVDWNSSNDIISGSAGIGIAMLWAAQALRDPDARDAAIRAGRHLIDVAQPAAAGLKWELSPSVPREYPNFSHGTAGVAYFLTLLYGETKDPVFLNAAIGGAVYLQTIASRTTLGGRRIFHHTPGGEDLFYVSWCHGPAGTARLFYQLGVATGGAQWRDYVPALAQGIVDSGVPGERRDLSGYWNNISLCCGNCGVGEFFLSMYGLTKDTRHLAFATKVMDDVLARGTADGDGLKWVQAENRVSPEEVTAQTGLMQGAAGVGLALLHLDGALNHRRATIILPDSPAW